MRSFGDLSAFSLATIGACILLGAFPGTAQADYAMTIEAVSSGGGAAGSGSYHESDSAVGEVAYGFSTSGTYAQQAGVVQDWGDEDLPAVVSIALASERSIEITFSELLGSGVTDSMNYLLTGTGQGTLADHPDVIQHLHDTTYLLIWSTGSTVGGGTLTVTVSNAVQDLSGNPMGPLNSASCSTVSDMPEFVVPFFLSVFALWHRY